MAYRVAMMKNGVTKNQPKVRAAQGANARCQEALHHRAAKAKKVKAAEQRRLDKLQDQLKTNCWECWRTGASVCTCPQKQADAPPTDPLGAAPPAVSPAVQLTAPPAVPPLARRAQLPTAPGNRPQRGSRPPPALPPPRPPEAPRPAP